MCRFVKVRDVSIALAALALPAGCSGGGMAAFQNGQPAGLQSITGSRALSTVRQVASGPSVLRPGVLRLGGAAPSTGYISDEVSEKGRLEIFFSDAENDDILILNAACKQIGKVTGFSEPQGIAIDKNGSLYVADTANSDILVLAKPYKGKPLALRDAGEYPAGVAVDGKDNVGATNIISTSGGPGSVTFYDKNGKQGKTISNSNFARVYFGAFDARGNFFLDGQNGSGDTVLGEIVGGAAGTAITPLTTSNAISFPGGLQINTANQIVVVDQQGDVAYTYDQPHKGVLGKPVYVTPFDGASDPVTFAFTASGKDLWAVDGGLAVASEFPYPKGGSSIESCDGNGQPIGIALNPAAQP